MYFFTKRFVLLSVRIVGFLLLVVPHYLDMVEFLQSLLRFVVQFIAFEQIGPLPYLWHFYAVVTVSTLSFF